jgi:hypothetical protein
MYNFDTLGFLAFFNSLKKNEKPPCYLKTVKERVVFLEIFSICLWATKIFQEISTLASRP